MQDKILTFIGISLGVGALLVGASLVMAAVNLQADISPDWLVTSFQWVFLILGSTVAIIVAFGIGGLTFVKVVKEVKNVSNHYHQEVVMVKQRTPTLAAALALFSQGFVNIADHSFGKDDAAAVAVSFLLLAIFWISNEACIHDSQRVRVIGYVLWVFAILCLPLAILAQKDFTLATFLNELVGLKLKTQLACGLGGIILLLLPWILAEKEPHNTGLKRTAGAAA